MKRFNRVLSMIIAAMISVSLFAGCSNSSKSTPDAAKPKNVTLRFAWWGADARHKATLAAIKLYTTKYPNVKINAEYGGEDGYYQKLVTELSGNTAPDIIQIDVTWVPELTAQGDFFVDLSKQKSVDTKSFSDTFLKQYSYANKELIGLPTGINAEAMLYNLNFFKKYGIDPKTVWNWDNLMETAKMVHEKDKNAYLLNFDSTVSYYLLKMYTVQKTGTQWIKDDNTLGFDKKTLTDSFTYLSDLFKVGAIQPFAQSAPFQGKPESDPKWLNGQLGMLLNWTSMYPADKATVPALSISMAPLDPKATDTAITLRPSQLLAINKNSKNVEEASKFLNWFFNDPEAAKALGDSRGVPASSTASNLLVQSKLLDPVLNAATISATKIMGTPENGISQNQEIEKISTDIIQQLAYNKLTPEQAADTLISSYTQKLSELKSQK